MKQDNELYITAGEATIHTGIDLFAENREVHYTPVIACFFQVSLCKKV